LQIIPIINKIEVQAADVAAAVQQLAEQFDFSEDEIIYISAKEGTNVDQVFDAVINRISPPKGFEV
jgi:translation elongation factor EF-4